MALSTRDQAVYKMAMEYYLNGASLDKAQAMAEAKYLASLKKKGNYAIANQIAVSNKLWLNSKTEKAKYERADRQVKRAEEARHLKTEKKKTAVTKQEEAKRAADRKKTLAGGFDNFPKKIGTIASYGAAIVIINKVVQAITFAITKTIEFEKVFTDLAVKSGYTNREMAKVADTIYEVAASTKFSTVDIVSAATALGKLGFEASEVIDILPNVANVAGATGSSLEETSKIFGKVLNAYSLVADQSQYVADLMVDSFNNSALDIDKFNTAFSYVGAAAASTGTSLTELTKAMAILSDRGVTASKIGTGLRNIFTKLGTEGDTLRGIIARVNEENLSFYEIAELVGRRAANQLFILMDGIEEFDQAIADSVNNFGTAWEANAVQMDTFSAKWDIFINNITNKVASLEFDPDETFRASLLESIDLMTRLNALKLFNEDGADIAVFNQVTKDKDFLHELSEIRKQLLKDGFETAELEDELLLRMSKLSVENLPEELKKRFKKTGYKGLSPEELKLIKQKESEILGLEKLFNLSDGDSVLKAIDRFDEGLEQSKLSARTELYTSNLQEITSFVSQFNTTLVNEFNDAIKKGNKAGDSAATQVIQTLIDQGLADEGRMKVLENVLKQRDLLTEELSKDIRNKREGLGLEQILSIGNAFTAKSDNLSGGTGTIANVQRDDIKRFEKAVADRKAWESSICEKAKYDSAYNWVIRQANIVCPENKSRNVGSFEKFDKFTDADNQYKIDKALYKKLYGLEDDPIEKAKINNKLQAIEGIYRDKLNERYENYLDRMGRAREAFMNKYPKDTTFDANIESTKDSQGKDAATGAVNQNNYILASIDQDAEKFKKDILNKQKHAFEMSKLKNELQELDRKDVKARKIVLDKMDKANDEYYDTEEERLSEYILNTRKLLDETLQFNLEQSGGYGDNIGATINTNELETLLASIQAELFKLMKEREDGKSNPNKFDKEDWDYFSSAMSMYDATTDLFNTLGDLKLELLQAQIERELEIVQERFDREAEIRTSALESGVISQEEAIRAEERARKKKIDLENKANRKLFDAQKKRDKETAIFTGIASIAQATALAFTKGTPIEAAIMAAIAAAAITASTAINIQAIGKRKFVPQRYAEGGIVHGRPHSQGGVPFSVNGSGGYEMEGGEFIVNKEATKAHLAELERINGKTKRSQTKFASGGKVIEVNDNSELLAMIAESLDRPVRAFVTDQDLATSESERLALTKKTSY